MHPVNSFNTYKQVSELHATYWCSLVVFDTPISLAMPISAEQWRASVGGTNAARSHVLRMSLRQKFPCKSLLSQILSFLMTLLMGTSVTDASMGKYGSRFKSYMHDDSIDDV